jgi:hypothetical protein
MRTMNRRVDVRNTATAGMVLLLFGRSSDESIFRLKELWGPCHGLLPAWERQSGGRSSNISAQMTVLASRNTARARHSSLENQNAHTIPEP